MIRHFGLAAVNRRRSPSFGIFPVHRTRAAERDPVLSAVDDPFYAADFRDWQVVEADQQRFDLLNARILAREKIRPHVDLERAIMAVRVGRNMLGVQFHPEASPDGMALHFLKDEKMKSIIRTYGAKTYDKMLRLLKQPEALAHTHATIIPRFLHHAFEKND
jgi:GMP synthase-like glutamine amidotransferase